MNDRRVFVVGTTAELPPGSRRIVDIDGRSVGVFNIDGSYFAVRNTCPHASGPLCLGRLSGLVVSAAPGQYEYLRRGEFLRCPWHQWEFDIRSGQSWFDPNKTRVGRFDVDVRSGADLMTGEDDLVRAGMTKGPYVAETYPVVLDGEYVVVAL
ncbi:Rieske (2Fe-2S) protein [Saccharopolyspora sp. 5N708]|uniref:Rieske (2Fe-2S) protein n=1 Tax=Saccharopolyspora sp. 5N708 TaxID=3457424 RepID=UPI003FCF429E